MVKLTDKQMLILAAAGLAVAWYAKNRVVAVVTAVAPLVNPFDDRNLAYSGANGLGALLSGEQDFSLGIKAYDVTHNGTFNPLSTNNLIYRNIAGGSLGTKVYDVTHDGSLNPASTNNVIYRNIGGDDWSLGTKAYDGVQWVKGLFQ